ncbi:hypothetical protein PIB30_052243 [Stylosanthes scabra]|uniref:Uncharacterized protein n=1 Tax=Stylosanthes scabra TaxID=79078 RepID=A0ABU6THV3_9FABA|nr:hypothetical protein [Stylosanthes scabra]
MGFGALSHLQNNNLYQVMLKQIYDRFDIHDNTIHSDAASVKITARKIGDALGLCSTGTAYEPKVVRKKLSQEDKDTHKFLQGMTTVTLTEMVQIMPVDTEDNRKRFMRAFMLWIQKGLIKTGEMMAKKDALKRKNPNMRVPPSKRNFESESESYQPTPDSEATESDLPADAEQQHDSEPEQEADLAMNRHHEEK